MGMKSLRPKGYLGRLLWVWLWGPIAMLSAFVPLMTFNLLQFPSLLVLPFSKRLFHQYNRVAAFGVWGWWAWSIQNIIGVDIVYSGDDVPAEENAIVLANHQSMGDIPVVMCLALAKRRVADTKWMVKDPVKYVPGVGWGLLFLDAVFLKRRWADDERAIQRTFQKYIDRNGPLWLVVYPEGTRITPKKLAGSQAYAAKAGIKATENVLLPRPKGFAASVFGLKSQVKAVYDLTIQYHSEVEGPPTLVGLIRGDVDWVKVHVRRYPVHTLPEGEKALGEWLLARQYEKDALMAELNRNGSSKP